MTPARVAALFYLCMFWDGMKAVQLDGPLTGGSKRLAGGVDNNPVEALVPFVTSQVDTNIYRRFLDIFFSGKQKGNK